jgi:hypothetical protein
MADSIPNPDFRALCAKTVEHWEGGISQKEMHFFVEHLKAALAQPAPEPLPTLEEAFTTLGYQYGEEAMSNVRVGWDLRGRYAQSQPAPEPPTDVELDAIWWKQIEAPYVILGLGRVGFRNAARAVWALAVGQGND